MTHQISPNWELLSLMPGGIEGDRYRVELSELEAEIRRQIDREPDLEKLLALDAHSSEMWMLAMCEMVSDTTARVPREAYERCIAIRADMAQAWGRFEQHVARCDADVFAALCAEYPDAKAFLEHKREGAHLLLPPGEHATAQALTEDGIFAWFRYYERVFSALKVLVGEGTMGVGQANNLGRFSNEEPVRRQVHDALQTAWATVAEDCAHALTHIHGHRGAINRRIGVDELAGAVHLERIERASLYNLLDACKGLRPDLQRYLRAKATLIGKERLDWWDLWAPLPGSPAGPIWPDAPQRIVDDFAAFSPQLAVYAEHAIRSGWVEVEDRANKRPGAFSAHLPRSGEQRVYLTWGGGNSLRTLSHELGHAYHQHLLQGLHPSRTYVPYTLGESASNFAETMIRKGQRRRAQTDAESLALLDGELMDAVGNLMTIALRFDFEREVTELRQRGALDAVVLSQRMEQIQREAFGNAVGELDPTHWASRMHFYFPDRTFYNFPYAFGFLFSGLALRQAAEAGPTWADHYDALLRDTGTLSCEQLALKHLDVDIRKPGAWDPVLDSLRTDVDRFVELATSFASTDELHDDV